jgi:DNA polymerase-3 subunit epsilon
MAQPTLLDIGEPLHATTFVVIDLETTGASARTSAITEIGAVKTRGGEVIGEFQTLVDPDSAHDRRSHRHHRRHGARGAAH